MAGSELSSDGTTITSSTVPGLGEISGRAILALGKVTLRGAEYVIIRRRLDAISTKFPHRNGDQILGIEQMYDDILELSRRDLYSGAIRARALAIILVQIGSRQIRQLVKCLLGWPLIETKILISELTTLLDPLRLHSVREAGEWPDAVRAYAESLAAWESHSLEPLTLFLQRFAHENNLVGQAILQGGAMDYLLHLYVSNFSDPLARTDPGDFHRTSILYAGCNSLLSALSSTHEGLASIRGHPFHVLWSIRPELPFTPLVRDRVVQRVEIWNSMSRELVLWRMHSIMEMMEDWHRPYEQELLMDIAADVLEFSGSESMEPELYIRALRVLHCFLTNGKSSARNAICQYMALNSTEYFSKMMSLIIIRISQLINSEIPEWGIFFLPWPQFCPPDEHLFKENSVLQIINSFIGAAQSDKGFLAMILKANILGLLRPFLQQVLHGARHMAQHSDDKLLVYDAADFELLAIIRKHGLRELFPSIPSDDYSFVALRRSILSRAFNVVLGREKDTSETEIFTIEALCL